MESILLGPKFVFSIILSVFKIVPWWLIVIIIVINLAVLFISPKRRRLFFPPGRRISGTVRREVFHRDGGECVECGSSKDIQYDHIIPFSRGGSDTAENIQLLCKDCNKKKGAEI